MDKRNPTKLGSHRTWLLLAGLLGATVAGGCGSDDSGTRVLSESTENSAPEEDATTSTLAVPERTTVTAATPSTDGGPTTTSEANESSRPACQQYRAILDSTATGSLTDTQAELRARRLSESAANATPEVQQGANELVAALEGGDAGDFASASATLSSACAAAGY